MVVVGGAVTYACTYAFRLSSCVGPLGTEVPLVLAAIIG